MRAEGANGRDTMGLSGRRGAKERGMTGKKKREEVVQQCKDNDNTSKLK